MLGNLQMFPPKMYSDPTILGLPPVGRHRTQYIQINRFWLISAKSDKYLNHQFLNSLVFHYIAMNSTHEKKKKIDQYCETFSKIDNDILPSSDFLDNCKKSM